MDNLILKIENVYKEYRLGAIGGTTLKEELQRKHAKIHHKEDPTLKIGQKEYEYNEKFMALSNINFSVNKGERIGIIGHNGAGKSTLLKLLSRVTAPTKGTIFMDGRVASMLEVGTGFHGELTGRENIYMNGAILGMTKKEIDSKIEDIIEFSEVRQFIDTPVKRYSSGMYVKLAFSVAAHLDSEIMIMDEVLAVGDMAFQKKCLDKMSDVSHKDGRTILYVSHNMNTIRQLCDRCIVLDHGKLIFDGDVDQAISIYVGNNAEDMGTEIDLSSSRMKHLPREVSAKLERVVLPNKEEAKYFYGEDIDFILSVSAKKEIESPCFRFEVRGEDDVSVGAGIIHNLCRIEKGQKAELHFSVRNPNIVPGRYKVLLVLYEVDQFGNYEDLDAVFPGFTFEIADFADNDLIQWNKKHWGRIRLDLSLTEEK